MFEEVYRVREFLGEKGGEEVLSQSISPISRVFVVKAATKLSRRLSVGYVNFVICGNNYAPFENINHSVQIVLVGITLGPRRWSMPPTRRALAASRPITRRCNPDCQERRYI
jgi:hypothetical protein